MKRIASFLIILALIACLCACGKSDAPASTAAPESGNQASATSGNAAGDIDTALIGNWQENVFDSGFIFNADGTGTDTFWDLTFTYSTEGSEVQIVYDTDMYGASTYSYSISGDTLSMTRLDEEETSTFTYTKADMPQTEAETESTAS